jgi:hypothetical protein
VAARPGGVDDDDAPGDSDDIKRFRRFFREHDLSGLPHRPRLATES